MAPRHTARAIVIHDDQLLLMERWRSRLHYFSIPGGGIEPGETPEQTVVREIAEETSLVVAIDRQVALLRGTDGSQHYIYLCDYLTGVPNLPLDAPEREHGDDNRFAPLWVPFAALAELSFGAWADLKPFVLAGVGNGFADTIEVV